LNEKPRDPNDIGLSSRTTSLAKVENETHVLVQVLERLEASSGTVVFDLDSTLLDNRPRQAQILRDFGSLRGQPGFGAVGAEHFEDWDLRRALVNAGVAPATVEALYPDLRAFWKRWFFSDAYCDRDVPVRGAPAYVNEVRRVGGKLVYLSGRPQSMLAGTVRSLSAQGFPISGVDVTLMLKPDALLHDDEWKVRACAPVAELGPVTAAFDNEPVHINGYRAAWPDAVCVHLDTDQSGRAIELLPDIHTIPDFVF
jgi:hypothetical protein